MSRKFLRFLTALVLISQPAFRAAADDLVLTESLSAPAVAEDGYEGQTAGPVPEPEIGSGEFAGAALNKQRRMIVDASVGEITAVVPSAPAEEPEIHSEALYRPQRGRLAITIAPEVMRQIAVWPGRSLDMTTQTVGVAIDAGLSKTVALGFESDYGQVNDQGFINSGWSDMKFKGQAGWNVGSSARIVTSLVYAYSHSAHQEAGPRAGGRLIEGNRLSGGHSVTPMLAIQNGENTKLGLKLSYDFKFDRRSVSAFDGAEARLRGGDIARVDVYVETSRIGFGVFHAWESETVTSRRGQESRFVDHTLAGASLYGAFEAARGLTIRPEITYQTIPDKTRTSTSKFDRYDVTIASIAARMTL